MSAVDRLRELIFSLREPIRNGDAVERQDVLDLMATAEEAVKELQEEKRT